MRFLRAVIIGAVTALTLPCQLAGVAAWLLWFALTNGWAQGKRITDWFLAQVEAL